MKMNPRASTKLSVASAVLLALAALTAAAPTPQLNGLANTLGTGGSGNNPISGLLSGVLGGGNTAAAATPAATATTAVQPQATSAPAAGILGGLGGLLGGGEQGANGG